MITAEDKTKHLLTLYKGNISQALKHAEDCLNHCNTDLELSKTKKLFKKVIKNLKSKQL